jgi:cell division septum initiation protein DivIVA
MSAPGPDITTLQTENAALRREIQELKQRLASLESNAGVQRHCMHVKQ